MPQQQPNNRTATATATATATVVAALCIRLENVPNCFSKLLRAIEKEVDISCHFEHSSHRLQRMPQKERERVRERERERENHQSFSGH
jgi:hypothetical protein